MRKSIGIWVSAAVAAILTYRVVFAATHWRGTFSAAAYERFFQQVLAAVESVWSYAHGWQPMTHIDQFGHFYAPLVRLVCPLIGFALFLALTRCEVGRNFWKPLGIGVLLAVPPVTSILHAACAWGLEEPPVEAVRTLLAVLAMVWSVGGMRVAGRQTSTDESLATA